MEWIKCTDRLPEKRQRVLIWFRKSEIRFGSLAFDGHWLPEMCHGNFDEEVSHWMPLPAAPSND